MRRLLGPLAGALLVGSCSLFSTPGNTSDPNLPHPYPAGCADFELSPRRCQAILEWVVVQAGARGRALASVDLLGDPGCGPGVLCKGSAFVVRMRLHFTDGGSADQAVGCGGVGQQYNILCTETPEIWVGSIMQGYRDVPCDNDTGVGCGIPLPSADPAALAAARPLHLSTLDIPIDHVGHYDIEAGRATLPNGVLSAAEFRLADPTTEVILIAEAGVSLSVRSVDPAGKPFNNYYVRGWHPGPEDVVVLLAFDVLAFDPGAVLQVRDLVVE